MVESKHNLMSVIKLTHQRSYLNHTLRGFYRITKYVKRTFAMRMAIVPFSITPPSVAVGVADYCNVFLWTCLF